MRVGPIMAIIPLPPTPYPLPHPGYFKGPQTDYCKGPPTILKGII